MKVRDFQLASRRQWDILRSCPSVHKALPHLSILEDPYKLRLENLMKIHLATTVLNHQPLTRNRDLFISRQAPDPNKRINPVWPLLETTNRSPHENNTYFPETLNPEPYAPKAAPNAQKNLQPLPRRAHEKNVYHFPETLSS